MKLKSPKKNLKKEKKGNKTKNTPRRADFLKLVAKVCFLMLLSLF
jgi:hypothetical protein